MNTAEKPRYKYFSWDYKEVAPLSLIAQVVRENSSWELFMPMDRLELIITHPTDLSFAISEIYKEDIEWAKEDSNNDFEVPTYYRLQKNLLLMQLSLI